MVVSTDIGYYSCTFYTYVMHNATLKENVLSIEKLKVMLQQM